MGLRGRLGVRKGLVVAAMTPQSTLPARPTDYFSDTEWSTLCASLEPVAVAMARHAKSHDLTFHTDTRWPLARLLKTTFPWKNSVSVQLSRDFIETRRVSWDLVHQRWSSVWIFFYKPGDVVVLANYSTDQLKDKTVIADVLAAVDARLST